jgi:UDP-N-acetylmuramate dehydrogenase
MSLAVERAAEILRETCGPRVRESFPMAPLTTFRIGGRAAIYLEPEDDDDLAAVGRAVGETGVPVSVLGKGSNVLVPDDGFPGLVLRLGRGYRWAAHVGDRLRAGGAMPLPALSGVALRHALTGLEFGIAIPASLGGAVRMNAGAHGREMADALETIEVYRLTELARVELAVADAGFGYRRSALPADGLVVGATALLVPGDPATIRAAMEDARDWRRRTQPLAEPNCGSVFTNPPGDHAARLIDAAGLKGLQVGGARVSEKHANFIVAGPGATARDVVELIEQIRARVLDASGIELQPEVRLLAVRDDG